MKFFLGPVRMMLDKMPLHLFPVLMLGVVSQIGQVLMLRELLMVFHGNELAIGIILSAWLAWVGTGSRLGAFLSERVDRPLPLLLLSALGVLIALPATLVLIRSLRGFFDVIPGAHLSLTEMVVASFLVMAPVCLLLGFQFVFLSRTWREKDGTEDISGAGKTYVGEALGNMTGGILFTFFLVHVLNPFQSAVLVAVVMLMAFLLVAHASRKGWPGRPAGWLSAALVLAVGTGYGFSRLEHLDRRAHELHWRHTAPFHELAGIYQSKHGNIAVLQREDQFSFFQSGQLVFTTAGPETTIPGLEEQEAVVFAHLAMVQHPNPQRVLLIGGGLRGLLREAARHPVRKIDYLELDKVLTEAARFYVPPRTFEVLDDPRIRLIHTDARLFVKSSREKYDLILVDAPDPTTAVLNRYYTREFFREAQRLLKPGGVLVTGATSTPGLRGTAVANRNAAIYHTLADVFSHVLLAGEGHLFFMASDTPGQISLDAPKLRERYRQRHIVAEGFSEHHLHLLLQEQPLRRVNWIVRNHGRSPQAHLEGPGSGPLFPDPLEDQIEAEKLAAPVSGRYFINSDFKPIVTFYSLMFWDDLTRGSGRESLKWLLRVQSWWVAPLVLLPLLTVIGLQRVRTARAKPPHVSFAVLFTVFTTGLSTMAMQVALLFSFQSIYGFIYETVGLIVAVFMLGLAVGAWLTHRYVRDKASLTTLAAVQGIMALLACLMALTLPLTAALTSSAAIFALFSALTLGAGLINGMDFPLATACSLAQTGRAEKSTGLVYGLELIGACLGAVLASVVVAPVMGLAACFYLAAAVNGTAFIALLLSRRS